MLVAQGTLTAKRVSQSWQMFTGGLRVANLGQRPSGEKWKNVNSRNTVLADYIVTAEL